MIATNRIKAALSRPALTALIVLAGASGAQAASPPVKLVPSGHIGTGEMGMLPGAFTYPEGVAVNPVNGSFYIADQGNHRVQEFSAAGTFVLMFGKEVNATTKANICAAASGDTCKAGVSGAAAGQFYAPRGITVEPDGDVYVSESINKVSTFPGRVQKFTADGQFVLELGKEVNETTKSNLCTQKEVEEAGVKCGEPTALKPGAAEHGTFTFSAGSVGNVLAYNENDGMVYVGEADRVQEFEPSGVWKDEVPAAGKIKAIAVGDATDDLYVAYEFQNIIHELNQEGKELASFEVRPRVVGNGASIITLAVDSLGHVAASAYETSGGRTMYFGALYNTVTGLELPNFSIPEDADVSGLGFTETGELLAADAGHQEVLRYAPKPVGELKTDMAPCVPGVERETSVTLDCSLSGEVDPWGVKETQVSFQWGRTPDLGEVTPPVPVGDLKSEGEEESLVGVSAVIPARPNETFYYRLAGNDLNVKSPEQLVGERVSFVTPLVAPEVVGEPKASFVKDASAVLSGELNPENASTEYFFEYAPGNELASCPGGVRVEACPGVGRTATANSGVYGRIARTLEATGLQPGSAYRYRLAASDTQEVNKTMQGGEARGTEESFTTVAAPVPGVETGAVSAVGVSSATISGTVNPDGLPATYAFELGVYEGAGTQYGVVFSGPAGARNTPVGESLALSGLAPGTTYAYRITVSSGYVTNEMHTLSGAPTLFTTAGLPSVLEVPSVLALVATPAIAFPAPATGASSPKAAPKKCAKVQRLVGGRCVKRKTSVKKKSARGQAKRAAARRASNRQRPTHI